MQLPFFIIDTFTSTKFKGNPTAVCVTEYELSYEMMLSIAREFNFPVTAFIEKATSIAHYKIKYFTTATEIPACGHATLASAEVVFKETSTNNVKFETIEKIILDVELREGIIIMTYPGYDMEAYDISLQLLEALGLSKYKSSGYCKELETLFIEIDNPKVLRDLSPDYRMLVESNNYIKEVVITSISDIGKYDFLLRSFCPWIGIDEDPVTGSVHTVLANFWKDRLGKTKLIAYQASERGGEIFVNAFENKVELGGNAVALLKGSLSI